MIFNKKTIEMLGDKSPGAIDNLARGIQMRYDATQLEREAAVLKEAANKILAPTMLMLELEESVVTDLGVLTFLEDTESKSVIRKDMEKYLLDHGVSAALLGQAKKAATKISKKDYQVKFTPVKDE